MTVKRFTIDVEENTQENAVFLDDKFICFEDDYDKLLDCLNCLYEEIVKFKKENNNLKQALWDSEINYYGERCDNVLDYESWIEDLKKEWDNEYWND